MPKITAQGKTIDCAVGANLRQVLLAADVDLYNGQARLINCRGIGSCGTCAVQIEGVADAVSAVNWRDGRRPVPRTIVPIAVCLPRSRWSQTGPLGPSAPTAGLPNPSSGGYPRHQIRWLLGTGDRARVGASRMRDPDFRQTTIMGMDKG
jgi:hypothetical protein